MCGNMHKMQAQTAYDPTDPVMFRLILVISIKITFASNVVHIRKQKQIQTQFASIAGFIVCFWSSTDTDGRRDSSANT